MALVAVWSGGCGSGDAPPVDRDRGTSTLTHDVEGEDGFDGRRPRAVVLFSGRIAHPHVGLTTWSRCPFEIERVRRVDASTLRVVGRESAAGCGSRVVRRLATHRLSTEQRRGGPVVDRVVVVSRTPEFVVDAVVVHAIA